MSLFKKPIIPVMYTKCSELPLYNFLKAFTEDDLNYLVKAGQPSETALRENWENIYAEYLRLSNDKQQNFIISCLKDISFLGNKLATIETIVNALAEYRDQRLVDMLHMLGFKYQYDIFGSERYKLELRLTITESKILIHRLSTRQQELKQLQASDSKSGKKENEYDLLLTELSKFQGYRIDVYVVTVSEFCAIVNRFKIANTQ